jgi:Flp pilus assembly protein TadD
VLGDYGKVLAAQGKSDDALAFLDRAIQMSPNDWTLYSAQGVAFDHEGKYLAAQASYGRALTLKPGEPAILNNDALSHMQAGDLTGAENLLRQVPEPRIFCGRCRHNLRIIPASQKVLPCSQSSKRRRLQQRVNRNGWAQEIQCRHRWQ